MAQLPGDAALWSRFAQGHYDTLIARAADTDLGDVARIAALRRGASADEVAVALQIADARRRLAAKTPDATRWIADTAGAQMASDALVAAHKAERFAAVGEPVADLCCGIGADSAAFARAGINVEAVDLDERRCVMARHNAGVEARAQDADGFDASGRLVHLDPSRRDGSRRLMRLGDLVPGPATVGRIAREARGSAIKLMPGVDAADLDPLRDGAAGELEYVSLRGRMNQAVWWTGSLMRHARSATMLGDGGVRRTIAGTPGETGTVAPLGRWLYQPDPAPERAALLGALAGELGLGVLHPKLGLLTGDGRIDSPWVTAFGVLERLAWRPRRVRSALAELGAGVVEVKTRGGAVDPDAAQRQLRGEGSRVLTVFVLRFGAKVEAIITKRV